MLPLQQHLKTRKQFCCLAILLPQLSSNYKYNRLAQYRTIKSWLFSPSTFLTPAHDLGHAKLRVFFVECFAFDEIWT